MALDGARRTHACRLPDTMAAGRKPQLGPAPALPGFSATWTDPDSGLRSRGRRPRRSPGAPDAARAGEPPPPARLRVAAAPRGAAAVAAWPARRPSITTEPG